MARGKGPARSLEREKFWRGIVAGQPTSGVSIRDWCDLQGVSEPSFYAWRRELARRAAQQAKKMPAASPSVQFVELDLQPTAVNLTLRVVVGEVRVEVAPGFDGPTLRRLLDVLRGMAAEGAARC